MSDHSRCGICPAIIASSTRRAILASAASDFGPGAVILCVPNSFFQGDDIGG